MYTIYYRNWADGTYIELVKEKAEDIVPSMLLLMEWSGDDLASATANIDDLGWIKTDNIYWPRTWNSGNIGV